MPEALRRLGMTNVYHHHIECVKCNIATTPDRVKLFDHNTADDRWMHEVGALGWVVISQDYKWHREPVVLEAIKQHSVRVFYLWGAGASKWATMRVFARAYDKIVQRAAGPGPFICRVSESGKLTDVPLP